jgi:mRNA interferase MazF
MQRGDIVLVKLPQVAGIPGHEQTGARPALIVHNNKTSAELSLVMIVPATSNMNVHRYAHTISVDPSSQNGLTVPSILMVFQLRAIDKQRIIKKLGEIETDTLEKVDAELKSLLGI